MESPGKLRGLQLTLGVVSVLVGAVLTVRPFASLAVLIVLLVVGLTVTGVAGLVARDGGLPTALRGVVHLASAIAIVVWPGATIRVATVIVAAALVVGGGIDLAQVPRVHGTARANAALGGMTSIAFGVLALSWPDVTVLVIAVLFGAWLVVVGVRGIAWVVRGSEGAVTWPAPRRGNARSGGWRLAGTALGAILAVALVGVSLFLQSRVATPDAFYDPPDDVPGAPGQLLRSEPFSSDEIPAGASAWKILYTTTSDEGHPAIASGLVIAPTSTAPSPVVAWAHGTTGVAAACAPSVLDSGLDAGAMFLQDTVIAAGWAIVATDYIGVGTAGQHPYLIGQGEGRSVLDAVRAAREVTEAHLADQTVVWGHSQGGHAALWAGMLEATYAPELELAGVAALAPAGNLPAFVDTMDDVTGAELFASYIVDAYTANYDDVIYDDLVRPGARIIVREMAQRCLAEPGILVSALTALSLDQPIWANDLSGGSLLTRLEENVPSGPIDAPLLVAQGGDDGLVTPSAQDAYVGARCADGYALDYRTYEGRGHVPLVEPDSPLVPDLLAWTADRFAGEPATDTCS